MTKIYNDTAEVNAKLMHAVVEFGRRPLWAGHPMEDRALAKALLIGMEKLGVLFVGGALQSAILRCIDAGFYNNPRFVMPSGSERYAFLQQVTTEFLSVLGDDYTEYSAESIIHYTWQSGALDGVCRLDDLNCANGVYKGDYAVA